jgi:hypothetical protein
MRHKKADALASAFVFQARSTAFVDDFLGATFAGANHFTVSRCAFIDNLQRVIGRTFGINFRRDLAFQLFTRLTGSKRTTRKAQQTYCQHELLHRSHSLVGLKEAGIERSPDALTL